MRALAILIVLLVIALAATTLIAVRFAKRYYAESLARSEAERELDTWVEAELEGLAKRKEREH